MDTDTKARLLEALGIAESIAMGLRTMLTSNTGRRWTADEFADTARRLEEIEDRLYRRGEYAQAINVRACPPARGRGGGAIGTVAVIGVNGRIDPADRRGGGGGGAIGGNQ
jgi:tetrahydromethanopterin S-methyltransferase subunit G